MHSIMRKWGLFDFSIALGSCLIAIPIMFYTGGEFIIGFFAAITLTFSFIAIGRFIGICKD